tara:strand:+ start:1223 stop:1558 length:336 start_codon:yes stop_codon:yes gene_type:complete
MNHEYFEKYFNDAINEYDIRVDYLELCVHNDVQVLWRFINKRLYIKYHGDDNWQFSLDEPSAWPFKVNLQIVFNSIENKKWNDIGNPIKTELLAHLRQLNELDGSLTKAAK